MEQSAGILIIYDNKILLAHSSGKAWTYSYSIPKGHIEKGESKMQAAIRETQEEVGITITSNQLQKLPVHKIDYIKKGEIHKTVYYYVLHINDLSEIGLTGNVVPKNQLQLKEVDWAGFLDYKEASKRIYNVLKDCLKHLNESKYFKLENFKGYE